MIDMKTKGADNQVESTGILSTKQVGRLQSVLNEVFDVHGRRNFPTLYVCLKDLIQEVRYQLIDRGMTLTSTKLNGGAASHILAASNDFTFSDLDLIFSVDLGVREGFDVVREAVMESLLKFLPTGTACDKMGQATLKDAYIRKMVKVEDNEDRWSLFSLNNEFGRCIELKFVDKMRRQFEFSVDSFQIQLDSLLDEADLNVESSPATTTTSSTVSSSSQSMSSPSSTESSSGEDSEDTESTLSQRVLLPTNVIVQATSMYGDFRAALNHLNQRLIDTKRPEEIRGGGLLKYCHLLVRGYRAARPWKCRQLERYMCSRFFIDFPDVGSQEMKLCSYMDNHFSGEDQAKYEYLLLLYRVVSESTVCLMSHERRESLEMVDRLAYQLSLNMYYQQCCESGNCGHIPRQTLLYLPHNGVSWIPVA